MLYQVIYLLKKWAFVLVCLAQELALAGPCEEVAFSDPESFAKAMTEGLILREGQDSLIASITNKTNGQSPLMLAVRSKKNQIIHILLKNGADPTI